MVAWCGTLLRHRVLRSYLVDLLIIGVIFGPYFLVETIPPFERQFWPDDRSIMFPYREQEIVPNWILPFISLGIPMAIIAAWMAVQKFSNRRLFVAFLGLLLALAVTVQLTNITKLLAGRLRPDFLERCNLDPNMLEQVVCRGPARFVREGRKSFPSGHTSSSFAGLGYAAFFLAGQLGLFDGQGYVLRFVIVLLPFSLAGFVGITRIMDYRHHWQDVLAGAILGTTVAFLCYRMYFPPIMGTRAEEPYDERYKVLADKDSESTPPHEGSPPLGLDAV